MKIFMYNISISIDNLIDFKKNNGISLKYSIKKCVLTLLGFLLVCDKT